MARSYLLDTDVIIDFLRGHSEAQTFMNAHFGDVLVVSAVTIAELYAGVREGKERQQLEQFISILVVCPITDSISKTAGLYKRDFGKRYGIGLPDAVIAATAQSTHSVLITLNKKHFPMLKDLLVPYHKSSQPKATPYELGKDLFGKAGSGQSEESVKEKIRTKSRR